MFKDARKQFDIWLRKSKKVHPEYKKLLLDPLQQNVTQSHVTMLFLYKNLPQEVPDELKDEAIARCELAHQAIRNHREEQLRTVWLYTVMAPESERNSVIRELTGLANDIRDNHSSEHPES
jgi:hypothetical protein